MFARSGSAMAASAAAAVVVHDLQRRRVDALEAADVHGRRLDALRVGAEAERRAAARRAELMRDAAGVEAVRREVGLRGGEAEPVAGHEPEEIAAAAADGEVALHDLRDVAVGLEPNPPAVAAALVRHGHRRPRIARYGNGVNPFCISMLRMT